MTETRRIRLCHVSGDFPDPFAADKTPVIRRLIALTAGQFDHQVISLNRTAPDAGQWARLLTKGTLSIEARAFDHGLALRYAAPGRGLFHARLLRRLGEWIADWLAQRQRPDLIIGHKLTIEGIAAARAAELLGIPYALSIQGNTDLRIIAARPDLRPLLGRIFAGAQVVFPFAPWALEQVQQRLGHRHPAAMALPCPTGIASMLAPQTGGDRLLGVFHLRHARTKNLAGLAGATRLLDRSGAKAGLSVIGGGSPGETAAAQRLARAGGNIRFEGELRGDALRQRMQRGIGLVLPSRRETFGLVFIEALLSGLPIAYPAGAGVDGYFDGMPFAVRVDARDRGDIARAMRELVLRERELKQALAQWQASDDPLRFGDAAIARTFAAGLRRAVQ